MRPVKIIRFARGFAVGQVYGDAVPPGVRQTLVDCGRARWVEPAADEARQTPPAAVAAASGHRPRRPREGG